MKRAHPEKNVDYDETKKRKKNCDYCGATFTQKYNLDMHIRSKGREISLPCENRDGF